MTQKQQGGFTLIELMIVVAIIGILAAVALPAYQDYTTRAKMSEVITFAGSAKTAVSECVLTTGNISSCSSNKAVGLDDKTKITSAYVESLEVTGSGVITAAIKGTNVSDLDTGTLKLTPTNNNGSLTWKCEISSSALNRYVPQNCRNGS
ncbi:pilin [Pseudoalteromonas sp. Isolate6]|uniref:pilin n=1 Tax=Pseudoalteromonas sp. Isolate6 TaxID=2908527 RepID=UPI001EFE0E50|nr:pilin [Pseudoalteromonas sp. Isolate6]MCG9761930.1 pilin [Pseudoalteromonas sp. Isolate6]